MIEEHVRQILATIPSAWGDGNCNGHIKVAQYLIERLNPKVTVDLGVDYGYSLISLSYKNSGIVYGIDCFQGDEWVGDRNTYDHIISTIEKLNFTNIKIIKGYFDEVVKDWNQQIDILHIDGFHSYDAVKNDYKKWSPFVNHQGVILFHDTNAHDTRFGVKKFFSEIDLPKMEFMDFQGLGIVSKNIDLIEDLKKFNYD